MGSPYQSQSASGYNSSPPPDDGSTVSTNKITWATIKSKITDPLKTLADAVNTALRTALNVTPSTTSTNYTTLVSDHLTTIEVSGTTTISLGDAATMIAQAMGYTVTVRNKGTGLVTVAPVTAANTLDGISGTNGGSAVLVPGQSKTFGINQAGNGYGTLSEADAIDPSVCDFRLTLTTGTPVTTSDVTAATTLYASPYKGNRIALFDGTANWLKRASAEMSIAVPATTSTMYDVFCFDSAGVPTLELLAWTNDTTRATALTLQNGVYVKTGDTKRRYLGSFRTTGVSGQTEDSLAKRYVWNYFNRIARTMSRVDTTDSWNYSTGSFQQANAAAANQLDFVQGIAEDAVEATVIGQVISSSATLRGSVVGVGVDSTTVNSAQIIGRANVTSAESRTTTAFYRGVPGVGRHTLVWLEKGGGADTQTWFGDNGGVGYEQSGIIGKIEG